MRETLNEVAELGNLQGLPEFSVGRRRLGESQVACHRAAEQERLLRDQADSGSQRARSLQPDVDAVDGHLS